MNADGCSDCLIDIVFALTNMLAQTGSAGRHRRGWLIYTQLRLAKLLDRLRAAPRPIPLQPQLIPTREV